MIFLKLVHDGEAVLGDSATRGYEGQIEVSSLSWQMDVKHAPEGKDVAPDAFPKSVTLEKVFDSASTHLYGRMYSWGAKKDKSVPMFDLATIFVVDPAFDPTVGRPETMFTLMLEKCKIENISTSATESGRSMKLTERLEISFVEGRIAYRPPHPEQAGRRQPPKSFVIPRAAAKKA
jgi:hypothetical protein